MRPTIGWSTFAILAFGGILPAGRASTSERELIREARVGHKSTLDAMRTFSAKFEKEVLHPKKQLLAAGRYWRVENAVRIQEGREGTFLGDLLLKGGEIRQVGRTWDKTSRVQFHAIRRSGSEMLVPYDPSTHMLLTMTGPNGPVDVERFLDLSKSPPQATRVREAHRNCIRVSVIIDFGGKEQQVSLWFDTERSYLISRATWKLAGSDVESVAVIEEFNTSDGLFVPTRRIFTDNRGSEVIGSNSMTLSEVQVNTPIPDSVIQLPGIPSGTLLRDLVTETRYPIDSEWRKIGEAKSAPRVTVAAPASEILGTSDSTPTEQSEAKFRWLIYAGIGFAVTCVVAVIRHRIRRAQT